MKRSAGVTAFAVLFIVLGLGRALGGVAQLIAAPRLIDRQMSALRGQIDALAGTPGRGHLPPERRAKLHARLDRAAAVMQESLTSPIARMRLVTFGLLGLTMCVAGIGVWSLSEWARELAIWQAWVSIVFAVLFIWLTPPSSAFPDAALELVDDSAVQAQVREIVRRGQTLALVTAVALEALWNGLVVWFLTRRSVSAQFTEGSRE